MNKRFSARVALFGAALALAGCTTLPSQQMAPGEEPVTKGPATRPNTTPLEPALACLANEMRGSNAPVLAVAVGDVKDYTGKFSQNEGNSITQGGALMIYSALGKLGDAVQLQERFDTRIAELELAYTDRRQLGDGRVHKVDAEKPAVPWMPYFGGSILRSQYYIVGGITELNYNIASGGFEATVSGTGIRARTYAMNVGVDLRIVDTRTLVVVKTVSLQKQILGEEIGAGTYRFFGDRLVDVDAGSKKQEPLQLGVRAAIEHGVIELVGAVAGIDPVPCLGGRPAARGEVTLNTPRAEPAAARTPAPATTQSGLPPQNLVAAAAGHQMLAFESGSSALPAPALSVVEAVAQKSGRGQSLVLQLVARETEKLPPHQRSELAEERIRAVLEALAAKGVPAARVAVTWKVDRSDAGFTRYGAGYQLIATLTVAS